MKARTNRLILAGVVTLTMLFSRKVSGQSIGQWDFNNSNLVATAGSTLGNMQFAGTAAQTLFGTTTMFGIPGIAGGNAAVMRFPIATNGTGYLMPTPTSPNGGPGAAKVNEWSLIM